MTNVINALADPVSLVDLAGLVEQRKSVQQRRNW